MQINILKTEILKKDNLKEKAQKRYLIYKIN